MNDPEATLNAFIDICCCGSVSCPKRMKNSTVKNNKPPRAVYDELRTYSNKGIEARSRWGWLGAFIGRIIT